MGKIHLLDEHLTNMIAAGEVVERPASVVKELVENAVDAGASAIEVHVEEGGLSLIRVVDNGQGMDAEDCRLAFERHATSKIRSTRDLFRIRSLGFRGEALPSIAAVSRVELTSTQSSGQVGTRLRIEGGAVIGVSEAAAVKGTDIAVRDLFYNTPARLKYMKSISTEIGHISDYVNRLALTYPAIAFTLTHNGKTLLQTSGDGKLLHVMAAIYGVQVAKLLLPIEGETLDFRWTGYISKTEVTRANRSYLSTLVNGRYVRHFGLHNAILRGYHTLLPIGRYPIVTLHIDMDPSLLDVNVHPAKLEVRFSKEEELLTALEACVKSKLRQGLEIVRPMAAERKARVIEQVVQPQFDLGWSPGAGTRTAMDRGPEGNNGEAAGFTRPFAAAEQGELARAGEAVEQGMAEKARQVGMAEIAGQVGTAERGVQMGGAEAGNAVAPVVANVGAGDAATPDAAGWPVPSPDGTPPLLSRDTSAGPPASASGVPAPPAQVRRESSRELLTAREHQAGYLEAAQTSEATRTVPAMPALPADGAMGEASAASEEWDAHHTEATESVPMLYPVGQVHGTYIVAQNELGMYLIDQHAAQERIFYEHFMQKLAEESVASQLLLFPHTIELTAQEALKLDKRLALLRSFGLEIESFGSKTYIVRAHPHWFPEGSELEVIEELVQFVLETAGSRQGDIRAMREKAAILMACKASIKANRYLTNAEMESLLAQLRNSSSPFTCPHGRPIIIHFSSYDLEKMFKRVM